MAGLSAQEELIVLKKRARRRLVGAVVLVLFATTVLWRVVGRVPVEQMKPESVEILGAAPTASAAAGKAATVAASAATAVAPPPVRTTATALPESLSTLGVEGGDASGARAAATRAPSPDSATVAQTPKPTAARMPSEATASTPAVAHVKKPPREASAVHSPRAARSEAAHTEPARDESVRRPDPAAILEGRDGTSAAPAPAAGAHMMIQIAALSEPDKVDALRSKLGALGVNARFSKVDTSKGQVTRVRVGPFASRAEADAVLRKLAHAGVTGIIVSRP